MALRRDCPAKTASSPEYPHAAWIVAGLQNAHHGFLALLGYDHNLDPAFLNIEDRIRHVALRKDNLILAKFKDGLPFAHLGENSLGSSIA
ncbi:hypothetical protein ABIF97_000583 [Bradyrhizobium japonicum]|uniref:Uncharacterized protein n=1 Tax=Bradyrhizobium barranii subsp. barranii TaxID=2823807 RepID=A0A939S6Z7_9BRAD|nr:hypothetical protein [Bradyrhizobium barranii]